MRFFALLSLLPLLQVATATFGHGNPPKPPTYCGTTTVTKSSCETITSKAPAVTKTITKDKQICFTTETKSKVASKSLTPFFSRSLARLDEVDGVAVTSKVKVTETITTHPTEYKTKWADAYTVTKTKTEVKETCSAGGHKRSLDVEEEQFDFEESEEEYLSNAERLRRGLPLNKPAEKRTFGHGKPPPAHGPSCVPSTKTVHDQTTKTKTVTPTKWATTTKCRYTQTVDVPSESDVLDTVVWVEADG